MAHTAASAISWPAALQRTRHLGNRGAPSRFPRNLSDRGNNCFLVSLLHATSGLKLDLPQCPADSCTVTHRDATDAAQSCKLLRAFRLLHAALMHSRWGAAAGIAVELAAEAAREGTADSLVAWVAGAVRQRHQQWPNAQIDLGEAWRVMTGLIRAPFLQRITAALPDSQPQLLTPAGPLADSSWTSLPFAETNVLVMHGALCPHGVPAESTTSGQSYDAVSEQVLELRPRGSASESEPLPGVPQRGSLESTVPQQNRGLTTLDLLRTYFDPDPLPATTGNGKPNPSICCPPGCQYYSPELRGTPAEMAARSSVAPRGAQRAWLLNAPKYVLLSFARHSCSVAEGGRNVVLSKISTPVSLPDSINLQPFSCRPATWTSALGAPSFAVASNPEQRRVLDADMTYDLLAYAVHRSPTNEQGHYVAWQRHGDYMICSDGDRKTEWAPRGAHSERERSQWYFAVYCRSYS